MRHAEGDHRKRSGQNILENVEDMMKTSIWIIATTESADAMFQVDVASLTENRLTFEWWRSKS